MPRKKIAVIESPSNSIKNVSLTLQNEENKGKSNCTVKKKKRSIPRSRKKEATGLSTTGAPLQPVGESESPTVLSSKKPRRKISTTKSPRNSKTKKMLTETNMNVNNAKSGTVVKKKIYARRSSGKKEITRSPSVVDPFQFIASPAASCSKKPRRKVLKTKSPRTSKKRKLLPKQKYCENNEESNSNMKKKKYCDLQLVNREDNVPFIIKSSSAEDVAVLKEIVSTAASSVEQKDQKDSEGCTRNIQKIKKCIIVKNSSAKGAAILKEIASTTASSVEQKDKKNKEESIGNGNIKKIKDYIIVKDAAVLKEIKSTAASSAEQIYPENKEESNSNIRKKKLCDLQPGNRKEVGDFVIEIASTAASFVPQGNRKNFEENDSNMKKMERRDLQLVDREDSVGYFLSTANVALIKETGSIVASSVNSKSDYENFQKTKCLICLEYLEDSSVFLAVPCGHPFHSLCIQTWFQVKKSCPVCNPENSAIDDASNNCRIEDIDGSSDTNRYVSLFDYTKKDHNELHHIDKAINELKNLNEDINEFLIRCAICMETSRSLQFGDPHDQFSDFKILPCGHNVHTACAQASIVQETCRLCMEDSRIEDNIYEFPEEVRCVICLDTVESSNFEYISCCHSFHHQCIQTWFSVRRGEICPVCMASSNSNAVEDEALYGFLENVKCTICMDIEEFSEFQRLSCRHSFHTMCAQTWFQENNYCPICMKNVSLDSNESDEEVRCVICVDTEESSIFEFLSCCHSFHAACIQSWLKKGKSCPICNTRILDTSNIVENGGCAAACN